MVESQVVAVMKRASPASCFTGPVHFAILFFMECGRVFAVSAKAVVLSSMARIRRMFRWVALGAGRRAARAVPAEDLIDAACRGDAAAVQALLAKGADVKAKRGSMARPR